MAISVDVDLAARPRILNGPSVSITVDPVGGLGTTTLNNPNLTDKVSAVVDLTGTLTGGRIAMRGDISAVIDPVATRKRLFIQSLPSSAYVYYDGYDENPWAWIYKSRTLLNVSNPEEDPTYSLQIYATSALSVTTTVPIVIPNPPAPAPPAPPEAPGDFPMPVSGGITIRALHGVVVDMDAPTVIDGIPT